MKVQELVDKLGLKVLAGAQGLDREIDGCYISDLLSDVMGNAMEGNIWITLQTHKNVMAVASLKELPSRATFWEVSCIATIRAPQYLQGGLQSFPTFETMRMSS